MIRPLLILSLVLGLCLSPAHRADGPPAAAGWQGAVLADLCGPAGPALPGERNGCLACILHSGAPLADHVTGTAMPLARIVPAGGFATHERCGPRHRSVSLPPSRGPPSGLS